MDAFATVDELAAATKTEFVGEDITQANYLLEAASDYLRAVIGQDIYPATTTTYKAYPTFGREDLPQWPVVRVDAVRRDDVDVPYKYRPGFILVDADDPVDVTFTWGVTTPPGELKRLTITLAAQALELFKMTGMLTSGGLSSLSIDDFRAAFADGGEQTGITLSEQAAKAVRSAYGRGEITIVEAYT